MRLPFFVAGAGPQRQRPRSAVPADLSAYPGRPASTLSPGDVMDLLSVRLFARQLQGTHRRADDALFFLQLLAVAGANVPALGLPLLPVRLRLTAASGLLLCSAGVLLLCAAANARRFFALGCGAAPSAERLQPNSLRSSTPPWR